MLIGEELPHCNYEIVSSLISTLPQRAGSTVRLWRSKDAQFSYKEGYQNPQRGNQWRKVLNHVTGTWLLFMREGTRFVHQESLATALEVTERVTESILLCPTEEYPLGTGTSVSDRLSSILVRKETLWHYGSLMMCEKPVWEFLQVHMLTQHLNFTVIAEPLFEVAPK